MDQCHVAPAPYCFCLSAGKVKAAKVAPTKAKPAKAAGVGVAKSSIVGDLVRQLRKGQKGRAAKRPAAKKGAAAPAAEEVEEQPAYSASPPLTRRQA